MLADVLFGRQTEMSKEEAEAAIEMPPLGYESVSNEFVKISRWPMIIVFARYVSFDMDFLERQIRKKHLSSMVMWLSQCISSLMSELERFVSSHILILVLVLRTTAVVLEIY